MTRPSLSPMRVRRRAVEPATAVYTIPQIAEYPNEIAYSPRFIRNVPERPRRSYNINNRTQTACFRTFMNTSRIPAAHQLSTFSEHPAPRG